MATSARAAVSAVVAVLLATLTGVGGCATAPLPPAPGGATSLPPRASAEAVASPVGVPSASIPTTWRHAIAAGTLPHGENEHLIVDAVSPDGHLIFAESQVGARPAQFVMIQAPGWHRTVIQSFADGAHVVGAAYDGRYITYAESLSPDSDRWILWVWDSLGSAAPAEIVRNAVDVTGLAVPGPPNRPLIDGGRVFWVQGDPDGTDNLRMYTIASQTTKLIRRGHPGTPFMLGRLLLWPEMRTPGALTVLSALSLDSMRTTPLPAGLAAVNGPTSIAADGDTVAWTDASMKDLYVWRTSWPAARLAVRATGSALLDDVHVAGPLVTWNDSRSEWVLDLRTMVYAEIAPSVSDTGGWGTAFAIGPVPAASTGTQAETSVIDTAALPPLTRS